MATLTITIPDDQVARVQEAFAPMAHRMPPRTGPATQAEIKAIVIGFIRQTVRRYERDKAVSAAEAALSDIGAS